MRDYSARDLEILDQPKFRLHGTLNISDEKEGEQFGKWNKKKIKIEFNYIICSNHITDIL